MMKKFPVWMFIPICIMLIFIGFGFRGNTSGAWGPMGGSWVMFPGFFIVICIIMMVVMMGKHGGMCGMMGHGSHKDTHKSSDSMDLLKTRYVKGEISKKQFEEMKKELGKQ